jgi:hypothetical protein
MAIVALWLGFALSKVRERAEVKQLVLAHNGMIDNEGDLQKGSNYHTGTGDHPEKISWFWALAGVKPIHRIMIPIGAFTDSERRRIRNAFPELSDPCLGFALGEYH